MTGCLLTEDQKELFRMPNIGHLATIGKDGSPHVTPVWVDIAGEEILVNTAEGRTKVRNVRRDPKVGIDVVDHEDPYRMVSVQGRVVEVTTNGADHHIDALSLKYKGLDKYQHRKPGERRVILRIQPERVATRRV